VDTWDPGLGATTLADVLASLAPWLLEADGLTVSGGEPFEQREALHQLLKQFRSLARPDTDILVYSGYPWETLAPQIAAWPGLIDVLISDPFLSAAGQTRVWRGSDNQRMHLLTPLGHSRFGPWVDAPRSALPRAMDVFFSAGEVWMAGIPEPGSLHAIKSHLADAGFRAATSQSGAALLPG
jgi:anaerobic ribonucleoside-triphosphate reductase activating protein